jgi:hypothetical protein
MRKEPSPPPPAPAAESAVTQNAPEKGGCASCTTASSRSDLDLGSFVPALMVLLALNAIRALFSRRRRGSRAGTRRGD